MTCKNFRVIVAGGGVAGLTMANMLEKAGIDYVVLEAHSQIAPQIGASIGIMPNGCRVLDQIGLYDKIRQLIERPVSRMKVYNECQEATIVVDRVDEHQRRRTGYDMVFVDRQMVLAELWQNLRSKDKVLPNKRITHVSLIPNSVEVKTADGQVFAGDVLIGADGVHSKVRSEMWRLADALEPGYIPSTERTECLPVAYRCVFGMSTLPDWDEASTSQQNMFKDFSYLIVTGPNDRVYWFLFLKSDFTTRGPKLPTNTKADEDIVANAHLDDKLSNKHTFRDLYATKLTSTLTPVPVYVFKKWYFDRIMTIGDAVHKFNPIGGQGANSAIETAGVLVSNLVRMLRDNPTGTSTADIKQAFAATQQKREARVRWLCDASKKQARTASKQDLSTNCLIKVVLPFTEYDEFMDPWQVTFAKGHIMDVFEKPKRKHCNPYADELPTRRLDGTGTTSRVAWLVTWVLLCAICNFGWRVRVSTPPEAVSRWMLLGSPPQNTNISVHGVDTTASSPDWAWSAPSPGSDNSTRLQCLYYMISLAPLLYIWTVEGYRHGNKLSPVRFPVLFGVYQIFGFGVIAPFYYLISLFTIGNTIYTRPTGRVIPSSVAKALLPSVFLAYLVPAFMLSIQYGYHAAQQNTIAFWQPFPVYVAVLTWFLSRIIESFTPTKRDPISELVGTGDLDHLMYGYMSCAAIAAIAHLFTLMYGYLTDPVALWLAFFDVPSLRDRTAGGLDFLGVLRWHMILCFAAVMVWLLYSIFELRRLGYVTTKTAVYAASAALVGQILVGPGATYAGMWAWREKLIAELSKQEQ